MAHDDTLNDSPYNPPNETEVVGGLYILATRIEIDDCLNDSHHCSDRQVTATKVFRNGDLSDKVHP